MKNREGHRQYDCVPDWTAGRAPGLSALVRLHNEEVWIGPCLESIVGWCDQIVVCLNLCTDRTPEIVERFRLAYPGKFSVYPYPFRIHAMGPGHADCPEDSVHSSAYYYNFCQSKSRHTHVVKWDGDCVAMDWLGPAIRKLMDEGHDRIRFEGRDIVGDDVRHIGSHPLCRTNGVYRVKKGTMYRQGPLTQNLTAVPDADDAFGHRPAFLHFKWCRKSVESATVQWPADWQSIPHFQKIFQRRIPVREYCGPYPASVRRMMEKAA